MKNKNLIFSFLTVVTLEAGVNKLADTVRVTIGPKRNRWITE